MAPQPMKNPFTAFSCTLVRFYVAKYSLPAAETWAKDHGATDAEIESARQCFASGVETTPYHADRAQVTGNADIGLSIAWRDSAISWAQRNDSVRELWLFGSRTQGEWQAGGLFVLSLPTTS
jgi:hypothetical protein